MNNKLIPTVLMATIMIAGISAFTPVDMASTVHTTITDILGVAGGADIADDIDDVQTQIDQLMQLGFCEQVVGAVDPGEECITAARDGILYIQVFTTLDATTGLKVQLNGVDTCLTDVAITVADSPFTCTISVVAGDIVTLLDASNDDSTGIGDANLISSPVDPT